MCGSRRAGWGYRAAEAVGPQKREKPERVETARVAPRGGQEQPGSKTDTGCAHPLPYIPPGSSAPSASPALRPMGVFPLAPGPTAGPPRAPAERLRGRGAGPRLPVPGKLKPEVGAEPAEPAAPPAPGDAERFVRVVLRPGPAPVSRALGKPALGVAPLLRGRRLGPAPLRAPLFSVGAGAGRDGRDGERRGGGSNRPVWGQPRPPFTELRLDA